MPFAVIKQPFSAVFDPAGLHNTVFVEQIALAADGLAAGQHAARDLAVGILGVDKIVFFAADGLEAGEHPAGLLAVRVLGINKIVLIPVYGLKAGHHPAFLGIAVSLVGLVHKVVSHAVDLAETGDHRAALVFVKIVPVFIDRLPTLDLFSVRIVVIP